MPSLSLILGVWKNKVPESILAAEFDTRLECFVKPSATNQNISQKQNTTTHRPKSFSLDYLDTEQTI